MRGAVVVDQVGWIGCSRSAACVPPESFPEFSAPVAVFPFYGTEDWAPDVNVSEEFFCWLDGHQVRDVADGFMGLL